MLHSPQTQPSHADLVLQLRKGCFYFPALALRCREGRNGRPLARPLSRRFVDMNRKLSIVFGGALRLVRALPTPFSRRPVDMVSVARIHPEIGQLLSFRTLITVCFRIVGELFDPVQVSFWSRIFFHANIRSDVSIAHDRRTEGETRCRKQCRAGNWDGEINYTGF